MNNHIVYAGYYKDVCMYVGEGKPDRYLHLNSGVSHVYEANYYHHTGKVVEVEVLLEGLTKDEAKREEQLLINTLMPIWNKASYFGGGTNIINKVELRLIEVFGRDKLDSKSKKRQVEAIRQIAKLMGTSGTTRVSAEQTKMLLGCPKVMHSLSHETEWKESKLIFDVVKVSKGLWEVRLK